MQRPSFCEAASKLAVSNYDVIVAQIKNFVNLFLAKSLIVIV